MYFICKRNSFLPFVVFLFIVLNNALPVGAQHLNPTLDNSTGTVSWTNYRNVTRYELNYWIGCRGPHHMRQVTGQGSYQVPGYISSLHLGFVIKAFGDVSGRERLLAQDSLSVGGGNSGNCFIPPRPQNLHKVGSGLPSNVPAIETWLSGPDNDKDIFVRFLANVFIYELAYSKCGAPWASSLFTILHDDRHTFTALPDYDPNVRYDVIVRGLKEDSGHYTGTPYSIVGRGTASNGASCDPSSQPAPGSPVGGITEYGMVFVPSDSDNTPGTIPPGGGPGTSGPTTTPVWVDDGTMPPSIPPVGQPGTPPDTGSTPPDTGKPGDTGTGTEVQPPPIEINVVKVNRVVSQHAGSSLVVYVDEGGNINANDSEKGESLSTIGRCKPGDTLAASESFVISCTVDGHFRVLQVQPQHPQDKRRDFVVFDAKIESCYRAYEYLDTGKIEIYYRKC